MLDTSLENILDSGPSQEGGTQMKLKSLAVITFVVFGCSALFGQGSFSLGFTSAGDLGEYCNYETIQYGGSNNFYMQGVDNLVNACFYPFNSSLEGVKVNISAADGAPVSSGPAYAYADQIYDASYDEYTGLQWFVVTQIKPSKLLRHFGWVGYVGFSGLEFLGNYSYLTASLPGTEGAKASLGVTNAAAAKESQNKVRTIK